MESLLLDSNDEDDKFVIDNLATLIIILCDLLATGRIDGSQV